MTFTPSKLNSFSEKTKSAAKHPTPRDADGRYDVSNNIAVAKAQLDKMQEELIPLYKIRERQDEQGRPMNEFHHVRTDTLEQSIETNGLMTPLILLKLSKADQYGREYQIISGHRRFEAYNNILNRWKKRLNEPQYNKSFVTEQITKYSEIPAKIFAIADDAAPRDANVQYITSAQEHLIYLESNFEARGLTFKDSLLYIDELRDKLKDDEELKEYVQNKTYEKRLAKNPNAKNWSQAIASTDGLGEDTFLSYILTEEMQISGWSRPSVTRYLKICDFPDQEKSKKYKQLIKDGTYSISKAYQEITGVHPAGDKQQRFKNKIATLRQLGKSMQLKDGNSYTLDELEQLQAEFRNLIAISEEVINKQQKSIES